MSDGFEKVIKRRSMIELINWDIPPPVRNKKRYTHLRFLRFAQFFQRVNKFISPWNNLQLAGALTGTCEKISIRTILLFQWIKKRTYMEKKKEEDSNQQLA
jgi:hypothetical protein